MTIEVDKTEHDLSRHQFAIKPHYSKWYVFWGNKCPVCEAPAIIENVKKG